MERALSLLGVRRRCFTLTELLIVIAVITLLGSILLPSLRSAREAGRKVACMSILRNAMLATAIYSADQGGYLPHGQTLGMQDTGYGYRFNTTNMYDVDPWRTAADQEICGLGQVMWYRYLPEKAEAISCPQADSREYFQGIGADLGWVKSSPFGSGGTVGYNLERAPSDTQYWRNDEYRPAAPDSVAWNHTTYVIRGPLYRAGRLGERDSQLLKNVPAGRLGLYADHEAVQPHISFAQPVPGWPRVHRDGINVAYADGHTAMFPDRDRTITYANSPNYYGTKTNGNALWFGVYDGR